MTIKAARDQHPDAWRPFTKPPRGTRDPELNLDARAQAFLDRIAPLSADLAAHGRTRALALSFEVLTQSARAVEPTEGAFDDPAPLQHSKSLRLARPFHDRKGTMQNSSYPINQLPGVTPVCPDELQPR